MVLTMSAPGNVLVFVLLMLDQFGACQVADLDGFCGCSVLTRVNWWRLADSRSLKPLSLVSPKINLPKLSSVSHSTTLEA
ncbi:hypothetical protein DPMN_190865 [Dreissena polymorpha]|uniref:Secreted protein n=1 Tax=Dreissena polymorpha TaxID=45954 RepID=A0A9D3Y0J7_DREPO|nr:hypothetical protein DPMN_190865 [Dreissena polymorpha]